MISNEGKTFLLLILRKCKKIQVILKEILIVFFQFIFILPVVLGCSTGE